MEYHVPLLWQSLLVVVVDGVYLAHKTLNAYPRRRFPPLLLRCYLTWPFSCVLSLSGPSAVHDGKRNNTMQCNVMRCDAMHWNGPENPGGCGEVHGGRPAVAVRDRLLQRGHGQRGEMSLVFPSPIYVHIFGDIAPL